MHSGLLVGKVVKAHPQAHAVDLIMLHNGAKMPLVQVVGAFASTNTGTVDMPEPTPAAKEGDITPTKDRDVYAIVGFVGGSSPVVLGFLFPQVSQLLFENRPNFRITKHASDVYSTLNDDGEFSLCFPNGSYLRVGVDPAREDLEGQDFDAKFKTDRNTDKALNMRLVVVNGGNQTALVNISPEGNANIELAGNLVATVDGNAEVTVAGDATVAVTGNMTSSAAQWSHTGPVAIDGDVDVTGTVTATTDVLGGGKSLKTHTHGGVVSGGSQTLAPT